jgi:hypothetical protein
MQQHSYHERHSHANEVQSFMVEINRSIQRHAPVQPENAYKPTLWSIFICRIMTRRWPSSKIWLH